MRFFLYLCRPNVLLYNSKVVKRYILIVIAALYGMGLSAYTRLNPETHHFVSVHGDLGYSALLHNISGRKPSAGMNTNIGLDYRLYRNNFLFSCGVEAMYQLNSNKMDDLDVSIRMMDTEGDPFDMHVLLDKSSDLTHMVNMNIPLLVGGEWNRFYFMIGPKFSINLYGATASRAQYTTYGAYESYYDDFYDMPNHQFESGRTVSSGTMALKWNFNIMAHVEIGGRLDHFKPHKIFRLHPSRTRMYLAAYMDFGLLNVHSGGPGSPVFEYRETDKGVQFYVQPLMLSDLSANAIFRNLNVGIKYTIAFELPQRGKSYIYDYDQVENNYRIRGGNQTIK